MRALIITANGFQDQEAIYPYYRLQEAGYEVDVATSDGMNAKGIIGLTLQQTDYVVHPRCYDLIVIPGGVKAMEKLRLNTILVTLIRDTYAEGAVVASICSGAQMLISAGLCKGKVISAYPAMQVDVENAGAEYRNAVTACNRIVTAPHYRDLSEWMKMVFMAVNANRSD